MMVYHLLSALTEKCSNSNSYMAVRFEVGNGTGRLIASTTVNTWLASCRGLHIHCPPPPPFFYSKSATRVRTDSSDLFATGFRVHLIRLCVLTFSDKGPSINYVRIFTCYLDPLPPFLHVIRNGNV